MKYLINFILGLAFCIQSSLYAQQFSIDWYKVSGGGGTSSNMTYSLIGTIGQVDANCNMMGAGYQLNGGFWVLGDSGVPFSIFLSIVRTATNSIVISWPLQIQGFILETTTSLIQPSWTTVTEPVQVVGEQYQVAVDGIGTNRFYRLKRLVN